MVAFRRVVVVEFVGDEGVALDAEAGQAYRLVGPAALAARALMAGRRDLTAEEEVGVQQLADAGLIAGGVSRRRIITAGATAATMGVFALAMPAAAAAASGAVASEGAGVAGAGGLTPNDAPNFLTATAGTTSVALTWADTGADSYQVWKKTGASTYEQVTTNIVFSGASATITGLTAGTEVTYVVVGVVSGNSSSYSPEASATPLATPTAPSGTAGVTSATVTWSSASGASSYDVRYSANGGDWITVSGVNSPLNLSDLTAGASYVFQVRGTNASGVSDWSASSGAVTPTSSDPSQVATVLTATAGAESIDLTWDATPATSYKVYSVSGGTRTLLATVTDGSNAYSVTGLSSGATSTYQVDAVYGGTAMASNEATATVLPSAPLNVTATSTGYGTSGSTGKIAVTWTDVAGETGYKIEYRASTSATWSSTTVGANVTSATLSSLTANTLYYVRVKTLASGVESAASTTASSNSSIASGGTLSTYTSSGTTYVVHKFTSTGSTNFVLNRSYSVEVLIIGGGGGGGGAHNSGSQVSSGIGGAGGGAGAFREYTGGSAFSMSAGTYPAVVGAGGAGGSASSSSVDKGADGGSSSFNGVTAAGGGGGGGYKDTGSDGGSGGGGGGRATTAGGSGTSSQGNSGGNAVNVDISGMGGGGGGGGAGGAGGSGSYSRWEDSSIFIYEWYYRIYGGAGGTGKASSITGSSVTYAGGGGGGAVYRGGADDTTLTQSPGTGGSGIGGAGRVGGNVGSSNHGTANTGSGGGGCGEKTGDGLGGDGASGVVILRYALPA